MHDIYGNFINQKVVGVEGIAEALRETIDYSACYVKRYFNFLTSNEVTFFADDQNDPFGNPLLNGEMSARDIKMFKDVRELGNKLKNNEINLKKVIENIIASDYFVESVFGQNSISKQDDFEIEVSEVDEIYNSLGKCISCHKSSGNFLNSYDQGATSCEEKKSILDQIRSNSDIVKENSPCESRLYLFLENNDCGNSEPPDFQNGATSFWMSSKTNWSGSDSSKIKNLINNNYSCDN